MNPISIFFMYSPDRKSQFLQQWELMHDMEFFEECQKILLVDGETNVEEKGLEVHEVPRKKGVFCWASMWDEGVSRSRNELVLYLDSDRVLPRNYLKVIGDLARDDVFLFCESLFTFLVPMETEELRSIRDNFDAETMRLQFPLKSEMAVYDPRFAMPLRGPGKGPMSGNTAFTKTTYRRSGGVDPAFAGHGAYADTDYTHQCCELGMKMEDVGALELHLFHEKLHDGESLSFRQIEILSLNNFIMHCQKWNLGLENPRRLASHFRLETDFVDRVLSRINEGNDFTPLMS